MSTYPRDITESEPSIGFLQLVIPVCLIVLVVLDNPVHHIAPCVTGVLLTQLLIRGVVRNVFKARGELDISVG